ncbi:MAG: hypothetical protein FIA90_01115 [candidate division NC10 bacterium]|nr:hypothetical protein [Candidatus Methylomirabilis sp.]NJD67265.1 hypothetical protein [candidate division NC10 bacterium]
MKVRQKLMGAFLLAGSLFGLSSMAEALFFPADNKIGWYAGNEVSSPNVPWAVLIYNDATDTYYQVLMWKNDSSCDKEVLNDGNTTCKILRGWGRMYGTTLYAYMHEQGNTIQSTTNDVTYYIFQDGRVFRGSQLFLTLNNHIDAYGNPFFGTSSRDGVFFSLQWGHKKTDNGCTMTKLDSTVGPNYKDWDFEAFIITDADGDAYIVLPAIGPGRTGMEYTWGHRREPQGSIHPISYAPTWLFNDTLGYAGFEGVLSDLRWWLWLAPNHPTLSSINGKAVQTWSRSTSVLSAYKVQGPGFTCESQYPPSDPAPGSQW